MNEADTVRYLATLGFTAYRLPSLASIEQAGWISKGTLARVIYPHQTCDTALPQAWVNHAHNHGIDVRPGWVMLYDPTPGAAILGQPVPLHEEALTDLLESDDGPLRHTATRAQEILEGMLAREQGAYALAQE